MWKLIHKIQNHFIRLSTMEYRLLNERDQSRNNGDLLAQEVHNYLKNKSSKKALFIALKNYSKKEKIFLI